MFASGGAHQEGQGRQAVAHELAAEPRCGGGLLQRQQQPLRVEPDVRDGHAEHEEDQQLPLEHVAAPLVVLGPEALRAEPDHAAPHAREDRDGRDGRQHEGHARARHVVRRAQPAHEDEQDEGLRDGLAGRGEGHRPGQLQQLQRELGRPRILRLGPPLRRGSSGGSGQQLLLLAALVLLCHGELGDTTLFSPPRSESPGQAHPWHWGRHGGGVR